MTLRGWTVSAACAALVAIGATAHAQETARGVVFLDENRNGTRDPGETGLPGVAVSNGREVVLTNDAGEYELPVGNDTILFVVKPQDHMTPVNAQQLPQFYYIHKPDGSPELRFRGVDPTGPLPESVDFPLYHRPEPDAFEAVFFGDTQPYNMTELYFVGHDVVTELIGVDAAFVVSLGDLVGDDLDLFEPLAELQALIGVPFYNVLGNHDIDFKAPDQSLASETFQRVYGPPYYAYEYGQVTFIVLENVDWDGAERSYTSGLGERQMAFLENFLETVPKDRLVVLMMHIPIMDTAEREAIFAALEPFPHTFSISGHWHRQRHFFLDEEHGWPREDPHHHLVSATVSGSWWSGVRDEVNLPAAMMSDGIPNGYSFIAFDGTDYSIRYKAARRPDSYQMNVYLPDAVPVAALAETEVVANIFSGSERSTVHFRVDGGPWLPMEQTERMDPFYVKLKMREGWLVGHLTAGMTEEEIAAFDLRRVEGIREFYGGRMPDARDTDHIWTAPLPADLAPGFRLVEVRTTDMFGQEATGRRIVHIIE